MMTWGADAKSVFERHGRVQHDRPDTRAAGRALTLLLLLAKYLCYHQDTYTLIKIRILLSRYIYYKQDTHPVIKIPVLLSRYLC